jgi:hypothetical protein
MNFLYMPVCTHLIVFMHVMSYVTHVEGMAWCSSRPMPSLWSWPPAAKRPTNCPWSCSHAYCITFSSHPQYSAVYTVALQQWENLLHGTVTELTKLGNYTA